MVSNVTVHTILVVRTVVVVVMCWAMRDPDGAYLETVFIVPLSFWGLAWAGSIKQSEKTSVDSACSYF